MNQTYPNNVKKKLIYILSIPLSFVVTSVVLALGTLLLIPLFLIASVYFSHKISLAMRGGF